MKVRDEWRRNENDNRYSRDDGPRQELLFKAIKVKRALVDDVSTLNLLVSLHSDPDMESTVKRWSTRIGHRMPTDYEPIHHGQT